MNKKKVCIQTFAIISLVSGAVTSNIPMASAQQIKSEAFSMVSVQVESGLDIKTKLPFNTKLVIRFNSPIERYTVDDSALFVTDEFGNHVSITKSIIDQDKTIIINPPSSGYVPGRTYTLHVKNEIYAKTGKKLTQAVKQVFRIQNEVVNIQGNKAHTFFIGSQGEVWKSGQDGVLSTEEKNKQQTAPQPYKELKDIETIVNGKTHFLALKKDGTVWAWGENKSGELGNGTTDPQNSPVQIKGIENIKTIIAANDADGKGYSIALEENGTVWTWGSNQYGQLGIGDWNGTAVMKPVQVQNLRDVESITSGVGNVFAVKSDGKVYAWGDNRFSQLGDDSTQTRYLPIQIDKVKEIDSIVAGKNHTLAYQKNGNVYAWGNNEFGQLGNGTSSSSDIPVQVNELSGVKKIIVINNSNFALKNDGTVWAWGQNEKEQLGDGTKMSRFIPFKINNLSHIQDITIDEKSGLALDEEGKVWTWGLGQQGSSTERPNNIIGSTPVQVNNLTNIKSIYAKSESYFAIGIDGSISTWGENSYGQLGDGTNKARTVPVKVPAF
ncbi:RCC1 domain-containing protein [Aneurinibacillus sp. REN35]|uniref:RCC1 domain-containing protein n=1 Tax=Aneurinibacillus sp. REN35 TaxID=3237286 RepID=UPI003527AC8B